jgi:hypothetical protein
MNPEDEVIDAIDELIDDAIERGPTDDYDAEWLCTCRDCSHEWHGLECLRCGCPGAYASIEERAEYAGAQPVGAVWSVTVTRSAGAVLVAPAGDVDGWNAFMQRVLRVQAEAIAARVDGEILGIINGTPGFGFEPVGHIGTDPVAAWYIPPEQQFPRY